MKTNKTHSPEFEKELYSEVHFLDKYGMFIIVLLLSFIIYVTSNYNLKNSQCVNAISENTNYTSKGKVYTLNIAAIENFYIFSKDFELIIDDNHIPCSILVSDADKQQMKRIITFVSSKELNLDQMESAKKGSVRVVFFVSYRTLVINPIKSLLFHNREERNKSI